MEPFQPVAMLVVVEARIANMLVSKPQGMSINEIAKATGLNVRKLGKILRALAARHVFRAGILINIFSKYALILHSWTGCICKQSSVTYTRRPTSRRPPVAEDWDIPRGSYFAS